MAMYDPSLQSAVLKLLERWERLPLSDLVRMLDPLQRPHYRDELVKDMEWDGLVVVRTAGDEATVELTPRGRLQVAGGRPPLVPPAEDRR